MCFIFFLEGGWSGFKIEVSSACHFEGLSNFRLSVEVLVHHTEDFFEAYIRDMNVFIDPKDVDSGGSVDSEEEESHSKEVLSLNSDTSASESPGRPPLKIYLKTNRSKRPEGVESSADGVSDSIAVSQKRKWEKEVLPAKAKKKVWDKEVDNVKKLFVKEDQRLIKKLGVKQWKHLVLNGEDGLQKVSFICLSVVFNLFFVRPYVCCFIFMMVCAAF